MSASTVREPSFGHNNPKVPLEVYRPPSYLAPAVKERKTRTGKPKTRTGCKTCKWVLPSSQPNHLVLVSPVSLSDFDEQNKKGQM